MYISRPYKKLGHVSDVKNVIASCSKAYFLLKYTKIRLKSFSHSKKQTKIGTYFKILLFIYPLLQDTPPKISFKCIYIFFEISSEQTDGLTDKHKHGRKQPLPTLFAEVIKLNPIPSHLFNMFTIHVHICSIVRVKRIRHLLNCFLTGSITWISLLCTFCGLNTLNFFTFYLMWTKCAVNLYLS